MRTATSPTGPRAAGPTVTSALLYGIGFGGFVDGILLHQILQWHHMVSDVGDYPTTTLAGLEANTVADGFFHVATWVCLLLASVLGLRAWQQGRLAPSWRFHLGLVLAGWGIFNLVEGLVNHHLLGVHHVRDDLGAPLSWDLAFLASGVAMLVAGWMVHRRGARAVSAEHSSPSR